MHGVEEQDHVEPLFVVSEVDDGLIEGLIESVVGHVKAVSVQIVYRTAGSTNLGVNTHERDVASTA